MIERDRIAERDAHFVVPRFGLTDKNRPRAPFGNTSGGFGSQSAPGPIEGLEAVLANAPEGALRRLLPPLAYDGEVGVRDGDSGLFWALSQPEIIGTYLRAQDAAAEAFKARIGSGPKRKDYGPIAEFSRARREFLEASPNPILQLIIKWHSHLGIEFTDNLHTLFLTEEAASQKRNTPAGRDFLARLEAKDEETGERFVPAARAAALANWRVDKTEGNLIRAGKESPYALRELSTVRTWICDMYMTEAMERLIAAGATQEDLTQLQA